MEIISKIILIGLIGAVLAIILKKDSPVFAFAVVLITGTVIFFLISDMLSYTVMSIKSLFLKTSLNEEILMSVIKISAVGIATEYFCSVIKDAGEEGIAKKIELASKTVIFTMMIPVITQVIECVFRII